MIPGRRLLSSRLPTSPTIRWIGHFFVPPIPATDNTSGAEQGDVFPDNDVEQGPVETGLTADFEEGPVTPEPTDELQEGSVTPTLFDSSASDPFSLPSNATPQPPTTQCSRMIPARMITLPSTRLMPNLPLSSMPTSRSKVLPSNNDNKLAAATPSTMPMMTCRPSYHQNTLFETIPLRATPTVTPTLLLLKRITFHLVWAAATARKTASSVTPTMLPPSFYPLK